MLDTSGSSKSSRCFVGVPEFMRLLTIILLMLPGLALAQQSRQCGASGVWLEILGAGSGELSIDWAGPSYLVWVNDKARVLVDAGAGSTTQFTRAGGRFEDLDAIVLSSIQPALTSAIPDYVQGSLSTARDRILPVFGPDGRGSHVATTRYFDLLFGEQGAYPEFAKLLRIRTLAGYRLDIEDIPTSGKRRWAGFRNSELQLSAISVDHGDRPALAWRVDVGEIAFVFAGAFSHDKYDLVKFARGADALVATHAVPEATRGELRENYAPPSKIGEVAAEAGVRTLILGQRAERTRGKETQSTEAITKNFAKSLIFANDLECWGF
jgi:ribonuclease BN (tRNA processing enzyme)